jgi:translation initiation factor 3 subunit L
MKVYVLLGDYESALQAIDPLDLNKNELFARVPGANATTLSFAGFSYMMLRRYTDAIKMFNNLLVGVARTKGMARATLTYEQMLRLNDQALALLGICLSICPKEHMVDETPLAQVKEKHGDKMARMAQGESNAFEDVFSSACPNFISASEPNLDDRSVNLSQNAYLQQLRKFMDEVQRQQALPLLRSYLKLFSSVRLPKLASMLETDIETLRHQLEELKESSMALEHPGGRSPIAGEPTNISSITVDIDGDLLTVHQPQPKRNMSQYFMQQAKRFQLMATDVKAGADPNLTGSALSA